MLGFLILKLNDQNYPTNQIINQILFIYLLCIYAVNMYIIESTCTILEVIQWFGIGVHWMLSPSKVGTFF
jgi:hypothetical protein